MNYYEHHLGDWAAATSHLTWDEDAAYTRLLRVYYHTEKAIPEGQQYRLAKASTPAQRKAVDSVLAEFFTLEDGAYRQKRADAEIARYHDKQRKAKASADARWSSPKRNADAMRTHSETDANALRAQCEGNALQSPDTNHQSSSLRSEEKRAARSVSVSAEQLTNDHGVDKQVAADWLTVRKAKKSPLTQTALDNLITEFATAGLSTADGVRLCVERGWVGFKPDWLKNGVSHETATNHRRRLTPADVCRLENEQHAARREGRVYNA